MNKELLVSKLKAIKLKTVKAKMIIEAIETGTSERGNHSMWCTGNEITMWYRGTPIITVYLSISELGVTYLITNLYAGEYDRTPATIRQRKDFETSVNEIVSDAMLWTL